MEKPIVKVSLLELLVSLAILLSASVCEAQDNKKRLFEEIVDYYPDIQLPIDDFQTLKSRIVIDAKKLNLILFDLQGQRAMQYLNDTLFQITSYGRIPEKPFEYSTFRRVKGERVRYDTAFVINTYAIGKIEFGYGQVGLITRVIGFMTDYIDIYLFDKSTGELKSLINAFEAKYAHDGHPDEGYEAVYNTSSIGTTKQIKWHQVRFGVTTDRVFDLSSDGYFRVIYQKSVGEFEY
jgi:hypothetical protein